jgi:hypothetical protein
MKKILEGLKNLLKLNYCLIFNRCFCCGSKKGKRLIFCSLVCAAKTVKDGLTNR